MGDSAGYGDIYSSRHEVKADGVRRITAFDIRSYRDLIINVRRQSERMRVLPPYIPWHRLNLVTPVGGRCMCILYICMYGCLDGLVEDIFVVSNIANIHIQGMSLEGS